MDNLTSWVTHLNEGLNSERMHPHESMENFTAVIFVTAVEAIMLQLY